MLVIKVLASLQVILEFFFYFSKKNGSVGRWETKHFCGDGLTGDIEYKEQSIYTVVYLDKK